MSYNGSISVDQETGKSVKELSNLLDTLSTKLAKAAGNTLSDLFKLAPETITAVERFEVAMTALTGNLSGAQAALSKTELAIDGTAYSLSTATEAVQNFVARGMTVSDATHTLESWGNAVATYSGSSNEALASVAKALADMQSKGTVSMDSLNALIQAGIPALDLYAAATGKSTDEVVSALKNGKVKSEDFISAMNTALDQGAGKFPALANAAKETDQTWSGAFQSMKASVARGSTAIIQSMDDALASVNKPSLQESVVALGKKFEDVLGVVAKLAGPVAQHFDLIAIAATGVGAALATWKIVEFVGSLGSLLSLTTPLGMVIAAFAGVAVAAGAAFTLFEENDAVSQRRAEIEEHTAALEAQTKAYKDGIAAHLEGAEAEISRLDRARALGDELLQLADSSGKVQEKDQAHAEYLLNALNPILGTNAQLINGQIEGYQNLEAAIANTIATRKAEVLLSSLDEDYAQAVTNRQQAYEEAAAREIELEQKKEEIARTKIEHAKELAEIEALQAQFEETRTPEWSDMGLAQEIDQLSSAPWYQELQSAEDDLAQLQGYYDQAVEQRRAYDETIMVCDAAKQELMRGNTAEAIALLSQYQSSLSQAGQTNVADTQTQQQQLSQSYAESLHKMDAYLKEVQAGRASFDAEYLASLQKQSDQLYEEAKNAGETFVDGQVTGLDGKKIDLNDTMESIRDGILLVARDKASDWVDSGKFMAQGISEGIDAGSGAVYTSISTLITRMLAQVRQGLDEHSPSKKAFKMGAFLSIGLANGVKDELDSTLEASKALAASVLPPDFGRALAGRAATLIGGMQAAVAGGVGLRAFGTAGTGFGAPVPALAAAGGGGSTVNYYSANIDAKNVREWNDVVKVFQNHRTTVRKGYAKG